ncbi:hypothetical protein MRX96_011265 [Rhipicephalus microplus]
MAVRPSSATLTSTAASVGDQPLSVPGVAQEGTGISAAAVRAPPISVSSAAAIASGRTAFVAAYKASTTVVN